MIASPKAGALGDDSDEPRMIVALILNAFLQHGESVTLCRGATGDRRARKVPTLGDLARRATRVEILALFYPRVGFEEATALRERDRMACRSSQTFECRAFGSEQTMADRNERLADGSHVGIGGQSVPPSVDSPYYGILEGEHARIGVALLNGAHRSGERGNRDLFHPMSPYLRDRSLGVRAAIALKRDAHRQIARARLSRCMRSGTIPV